LGELAIGAGAAGAAAKMVESLRFFVRRTMDGRVTVRVENPNGGQYTRSFTEGDLEAKYGKPEENHTGILREDRKTIGRSFNINKYGYEGAKRLAEEERLHMLLAVENGEDPALRNPAAVKLHKKLANGRSGGSSQR
jgi:hypothetical protein